MNKSDRGVCWYEGRLRRVEHAALWHDTEDWDRKGELTCIKNDVRIVLVNPLNPLEMTDEQRKEYAHMSLMWCWNSGYSYPPEVIETMNKDEGMDRAHYALVSYVQWMYPDPRFNTEEK